MRKTKTRWKKILSAVLVAAMIVTLIPDVSFTSYATEGTEEELCTDEMEETVEKLETEEDVEEESGETDSTEENDEEESESVDGTEETEEEESESVDSTEESEEEESEEADSTEETEEESEKTDSAEETEVETERTDTAEETEETTTEESDVIEETLSSEESTEDPTEEVTTEEETETLSAEEMTEELLVCEVQNVSVKNGTHYTSYEFVTRLDQADNQEIPGAITYVIPGSVKQNTLKVTSTNGFEPVVKIGDKTLSPSETPDVTVNKDKITVVATYKLNTADIKSKTITIAEQHKTVKLKVKYYNNNGNKYIALDTIVNGRAQKPIETIDGRDTYAISYGENVELVPQGLLGYTITSVKVGERVIKGKNGKYTLKLYEDTEVTIEHTADIQCNINMISKYIGRNPFTTTWDGYSFKETINYHGYYTIYAKNVETDEKLKIDAGTVKVTTNKNHSVRTEINEDTIVLRPEENPDELITVRFTAQGKEFSATLKTRKAVQSIKVKAARNGVLTHGVGFGGYYDVIVSPAGADTSGINIRYEEGTEVRNVSYYDDKIYIKKCSKNAVTNVQFTEFNIKTYKSTTVGKITVKISDDNIKKAKPTVKVKYITDTEMRLSVDRPEEFKDKPDDFMNRFEMICHVKAEAITSDSKPLQKNMKQSVEGYYDDKTQDIVLRLAKDGVAAGKGVAQDYKVTVSLVQNMKFSDGVAITVDGAEPIFSAPAELKVSTRNPYYENKLTLNRKVDKIYAGDDSVCVAEAQFSKNASYCTLRNPKVVSVPSTVENKEVITERLNNLLEIVDNTKLYVNKFERRITNSSNVGLPDGKYKVQVEALAADGMEPAKATVEFTVVDPYGSERITFPSRKLFKQPGKAASMTGTVKWFSKGVHKTTTWVVRPGFDRYQNPKAYDALEKYVTIKNGTLKVDKSFVLDADSKYNTVAVSIETEPIVYPSGKVLKRSHAAENIEITNDCESLDSIGFYSYLGNGRYELKYAVTEKENKPIDILYEDLISDRKNVIEYKIVPFHGAAPETIVKENLAAVLLNPDFEDVKYSSSNKNFVNIDSYGEVQGVKAGTGKVTFTVETTVGPKQSKKITFNIINAKPKQLGLQVDGTVENVLQPYMGKTQAELKECVHAVFLNVRQLTGTDPSKSYAWKSISNNTKHSLSVSGGKIVYKDVQTGIYVVQPTKEYMKVTLKDDTNKKTYEYQIKVNSCSSSLPTVKPRSTTMNVLLDKDGYIMPGSFDLIFPKGVAAGTTDFDIMADWSVLTTKDTSFYEDIVHADIKKKENDKYTFTYAKGANKLKPATYKCHIYPIDQNGASTAKPFTLTIKLIEQKGSFSPTTSYTLKPSVSKLIEFTGKQKNIVEGSLKITGIQNVNVNGQPNNFRKMFRIDNTNKKLQFIGSEAGTVQGYVTYTCTGVNGEVFTNTVKVTIKVVK